MASADFESVEWYEKMARWSASAAAAGDALTMLIAEIAQGHKIDDLRCALDATEIAVLRSIQTAYSPRLAACRVAAKWVAG